MFLTFILNQTFANQFSPRSKLSTWGKIVGTAGSLGSSVILPVGTMIGNWLWRGPCHPNLAIPGNADMVLCERQSVDLPRL